MILTLLLSAESCYWFSVKSSSRISLNYLKNRETSGFTLCVSVARLGPVPSGTLLTGQLPSPGEAESTGVQAWGWGGKLDQSLKNRWRLDWK